MMKSCKSLVAASTILSTIAAPVAGQSFVASGDACCAPCEYRLVCRTIVEEQPVTAYRLQTETILEERQVVSYKPVWETEMRERRYTVTKRVAETSSREERYTVLRPVWETQYRDESYQRTRMVTETQTRVERRGKGSRGHLKSVAAKHCASSISGGKRNNHVRRYGQ